MTPLLPVPARLEVKPAQLAVEKSLTVEAPGVEAMVANWLADLETLHDIAPDASETSQGTQLTIECVAGEAILPVFGDDERHSIEVASNGISLKAETHAGVFYGLQSLTQLSHVEDGKLSFPHCTIVDAPRFSWRGLMLDVSRHFMPLELVKRMIDGMARVKLNVLHLGLSNNQGFRVESKRFPRLHTVASNGQYFTQDEIRELIDYAGKRYVRIVPEFNMPGHSTCFTLAYQELATGKPPESLRKTSGVFDDEMNPASPHMDAFLEGFIAEMAALFPDRYWHFGGDEVTGKAWDADPGVQAFMKEHGIEDNKSLQAHFTARVLQQLEKNGKTAIGWEEVAQGTPPKDTIIQPWMTPVSNEIFEGYPLIVSTSYYLDHFLPADAYYGVDPEPGDEGRNVIGCEACIWTEVMDPHNVEAIVWPGLLAIAERFWSPADVVDPANFRQRLFPAVDQLQRLGSADLQAPERLAAKLCDGDVVPSVARLRDFVGPLLYYFAINRAEDPHDVTAPFSRLIETLVPETRATHLLQQDIQTYFNGDARPLKETLEDLRDLGPSFREQTADLPALHVARPIADALSEIAASCLAVLEGGAPTHTLDLDALMPPISNDLTGVLEAVKRRRKADLPLLLQETNIPALPALRRVLESAGQAR